MVKLEVMSNSNSILSQLGDKLESEANEKVNKAMSLFKLCDNDMKQVVLHTTGFRGTLSFFGEEMLREHFDTMDLLDSLDSAIEDMEYDIKHNNQTNNE